MTFQELLKMLKEDLNLTYIDGPLQVYLLLAWTAGRLYELEQDPNRSLGFMALGQKTPQVVT